LDRLSLDLAQELARFGPESSSGAPSLAAAKSYCRRLAQSHYENFTVASRLFPHRLYQPLCNVYAYCRWADDLADEAASPEQAIALLDWWQTQLDALYAGEPARHPVFVALQSTVRSFDLSREPLADLLIAFRQDQTTVRYATFEQLLAYCRYSANPVGRIVLALGDSLADENAALSDSICSGLQLANFCQDVRRDWERGRIYLPQELCGRHGWNEAKFAAGRCDDDFRRLLKQAVDQAESLLAAGEPLIRRVQPDLRLAVRLFLGGGRAVLAAIRRCQYDVWSSRPVVGKWTKLRLLASAWWAG
jgi:squalene synthase HpnC